MATRMATLLVPVCLTHKYAMVFISVELLEGKNLPTPNSQIRHVISYNLNTNISLSKFVSSILE